MRMITIGQMIPEAALPEIQALIEGGHVSASDFRPVLVKHRAEMEARGILPEYAAFALEYAVAVIAGRN